MRSDPRALCSSDDARSLKFLAVLVSTRAAVSFWPTDRSAKPASIADTSLASPVEVAPHLKRESLHLHHAVQLDLQTRQSRPAAVRHARVLGVVLPRPAGSFSRHRSRTTAPFSVGRAGAPSGQATVHPGGRVWSENRPCLQRLPPRDPC